MHPVRRAERQDDTAVALALVEDEGEAYDEVRHSATTAATTRCTQPDRGGRVRAWASRAGPPRGRPRPPGRRRSRRPAGARRRVFTIPLTDTTLITTVTITTVTLEQSGPMLRAGPRASIRSHRHRSLLEVQMTVAAPTMFDPAFAGELIDPDHPDYDTARQVFNGVFDKRPALIARCTSAADVQIALAHAREHDLVVAVRGGGHSIPGHSSCDGGLVIDTGPMKQCRDRPGAADRPVRRGPDLGRVRRRHPGARPGRDRRTRLPHRYRRADPGQRLGLAGTGLRHDLREPALRRGGDRGRPGAAGQRGGERRAVLGAQGRRRQLRRGDRVRVPAAPGRPAGLRGNDPAPAGGRRRLLRFYRDFMDTAPDEVCGAVRAAHRPARRPHPRTCAGTARRRLSSCCMPAIPPRASSVLRPLLEWGDRGSRWSSRCRTRRCRR